MPFQNQNGHIHFSYNELMVLMLREAKIHEGFWQPSVNYQFQGANLGMDPQNSNDVRPGIQVQVSSVGLMQVDVANPMTVDAAVVNPRPSFVRPTLPVPPKPSVPQAVV